MNYILFDGLDRSKLFPITLTRPIADIRTGIITIKEKWELFLQTTISFKTDDYLSIKYPIVISDDNILIDGSVIPNDRLVEEIEALQPNQKLQKGDFTIAYRCNGNSIVIDNVTD